MILTVGVLGACANPFEGIDESTSADASSSDAESADAEINDVDLSDYPEDLSEWSAAQLNQYFVDAGVFTQTDWVYEQDHATYYAGTPIGEGAGYMDDSGEVDIMILTLADESVESGVDEFRTYVAENHETGEDYASIPVEHMASDVLFISSYNQDEEVQAKFEAAYEHLISGLNITPDF